MTFLLALKRECRDNVLDSVYFSAGTSCQHTSDMFVRDDVTWLPPSLPHLFASLIEPSLALCMFARKSDWYRRWSRSRWIEDAHMQLFGHFVILSLLRYSRSCSIAVAAWNPDFCNTLSLPKCALSRAREVLSRSSRVAIYPQIIWAT